MNNDQHSHFSKEVLFYENLTTQPFFGQSAPLHPKQIFFFWQCHLKAEGSSISEHPGVLPWPKNLRKKLLCELGQCSFTAPRKCTLFSSLFLDVKPFFTMKKEKHHSKWLTPLERYDWDNLYALFRGVNIFWFWH